MKRRKKPDMKAFIRQEVARHNATADGLFAQAPKAVVMLRTVAATEAGRAKIRQEHAALAEYAAAAQRLASAAVLLRETYAPHAAAEVEA